MSLSTERKPFLQTKALWISTALLTFGVFASHTTIINWSLWLDELWVANSIDQRTIRDTLFYPAWLQPTPPFFLFVERLLPGGLVRNEIALRALPFAAGLLAIGLFARLVFRVFRPSVAWACTALLICSPVLCRFMQQVKTYSLDVLAATLALLLCRYLLDRNSAARHWWLTLLFVPFTLLAFGGIFFLPSLALVLWRHPQKNETASVSHIFSASVRTVVFGLVAAGFWLPYLFWVYRRNVTPELREFWGQWSYFDFAHLSGSLWQLSWMLGGEFVGPRFREKLAMLVGFVLLVSLTWAVFATARRKHPNGELLVAGCLVPLVFASVFSQLARYPMLETRLLLWFVPSCALCLGQAIQLSVEVTERFVRNTRFRRLPSAVTAGAFSVYCIAGLAMLVHAKFSGEPHREVYHFISRHAKAGDLLFVPGDYREAFSFYHRLLNGKSVDFYLSPMMVAKLCCPRPGFFKPADASSIAEERRLLSSASRGRVLWLYWDRADPARLISQSYYNDLVGYLSRQGCSAETRAIDHMGIVNLRCGPSKE